MEASHRTVRVTLTGGGTAALQEDWYSVPAGVFSARELPVNVLGGTYRDIEVSFKPTATQSYADTLKIDIAGQQKEVALKGKGV